MNPNYDRELNFGDSAEVVYTSTIPEVIAIVKYIRPFEGMEPVLRKQIRDVEKIRELRNFLIEHNPNGFSESRFPPSDDNYNPRQRFDY